MLLETAGEVFLALFAHCRAQRLPSPGRKLMHQVKRQGWATKLSCLKYDWVGISIARLLTNDSPAGSLGWRVVAFHLIIGQHITNSQVFGKALVRD
jgi:hypothetical protein